MADYELTRRDALAALAAAGLGGAAVATFGDEQDETPVLGDHEVQTVETLARRLYPSEVSGIQAFVEQYVLARARKDEDRRRGIARAVAALDEHTTTWYDADFVALDDGQQHEALREMGVPAADPDPDGSDVEQVRFHLVNELLFALYTTPTGGELVGLENPQGYPGGTDSYQRGP